MHNASQQAECEDPKPIAVNRSQQAELIRSYQKPDVNNQSQQADF